MGVSRLDGKVDEIRRFLELGVSKTAIAKITGVSRIVPSVGTYVTASSVVLSACRSPRLSLGSCICTTVVYHGAS